MSAVWHRKMIKHIYVYILFGGPNIINKNKVINKLTG